MNSTLERKNLLTGSKFLPLRVDPAGSCPCSLGLFLDVHFCCVFCLSFSVSFYYYYHYYYCFMFV